MNNLGGGERKYIEKHSGWWTAINRQEDQNVKSIENMSISNSNWLESRLGKEKQWKLDCKWG